MTIPGTMPWIYRRNAIGIDAAHEQVESLRRLKDREWDDYFNHQDRTTNTLLSRIEPPKDPRTDIIEMTAYYMITVELPGLSSADVKVSIADGVLTIRGDRKMRSLKKGRQLLAERATGAFVRTYIFSDEVRDETLADSMQNGILSIVVCKADQSKCATDSD